MKWLLIRHIWYPNVRFGRGEEKLCIAKHAIFNSIATAYSLIIIVFLNYAAIDSQLSS